MRRKLGLIVTATFVASLAGAASAAPALDAKGKCRDGGKFVAAAMCKAPAAVKPAKCRDAKGHFAKCGTRAPSPLR